MSIFKYSASSFATISSLPIARHGPKFSTGGIPRLSQTALKFEPASFEASGDINPTFSSPPLEHPADSTIMSLFISSFASPTVNTS